MSGYDRRGMKRERMDDNGRHFGGSPYNGYNPKRGRRGGGPDRLSNVLLITILNPTYPISVDVIHTITNPYGKILRIVISKRSGVQAMVEFESSASADRAMQSLNGADIYSGCCTLKIEFGLPSPLVVTKNDSNSWDYTNPNPGLLINRPPLLQDPPRMGMGPSREIDRRSPSPRGEWKYSNYSPSRRPGDNYGGGGTGNYKARDQYGSPPRNRYGSPPRDRYGSPPRDRYRSPPRDRYGPPSQNRYETSRPERNVRIGGPPRQRPRMDDRYGSGDRRRDRSPLHRGSEVWEGLQQPGTVVMLYDLPTDKLNPNKIFNLFCLYGNVLRVKFLQSKEGCAMVQMGDEVSVERAIGNLNHCAIFGSRMRMDYSKQPGINTVRNPYDLPDGTPSFRDYMGNWNNRFTNPKVARKNRILPPTKILHFFNAPNNVREEELIKVFQEARTCIPKLLQTFPSKNEKSSSGLLEFQSVEEAVEALVLCNHKPLPNPSGKYPFTLKLCFASVGTRATTEDQSD